MKAWILNALTGIDHLHLTDVPAPRPAAGEVVLDMLFAALNPADRYLAEGQYPAKPPLPHILGRDGLGIVREIGDGVKKLALGQHLAILRSEVGVNRAGTFAEQVAVPCESLVPAPSGWSLEQSACATLVYLTAHQALTQWGNLPPSVVLITGASGGVGVASTQLASAMGHTVIGLSRSSTKRERLLNLGAAATFDPLDSQWPLQLKGFLNGRRVDLAIDNVGGDLFPQVLGTLGDRGKVSVVGRLAGPVPQFNTSSLLFRRLRIGGVEVGSNTSAESHAAWESLLGDLKIHGAKPVIDQVLPFDRLPAAFQRLGDGPMGKVLISMRS